jgi:hypothetical protein
MAEMILIEALEKLALITRNGLDTLIQILDNPNESITIGEAIKAIRTHATDICETDNYLISVEGIRQVKEDGELGDIVYRVIENA